MAVARALQNREHLAVEAGTGVGKSLAYLIPAILFAILHRKKAVVSTHTINLQEQLTEKDLPMLAGVLARASHPGKFQLCHAQRPRQLPLHTAIAQGDAAEGRPFYQFRSGGIEPHLRMVQRKRKTAVSRTLIIEPDAEGVGAGLFGTRALFAQSLRARIGFRQRQRHLLFSARSE